MLKYYNNSTAATLQGVFPEHDWQPWLFQQSPNGYWEDTTNVRKFFEYLESKIPIKKMEDWYRISLADIRLFGPITMFNKKRTISDVLLQVYPTHNWNLDLLSKPKSSFKPSQRRLAATLQEIFPNCSESFLPLKY